MGLIKTDSHRGAFSGICHVDNKNICISTVSSDLRLFIFEESYPFKQQQSDLFTFTFMTFYPKITILKSFTQTSSLRLSNIY